MTSLTLSSAILYKRRDFTPQRPFHSSIQVFSFLPVFIQCSSCGIQTSNITTTPPIDSRNSFSTKITIARIFKVLTLLSPHNRTLPLDYYTTLTAPKDRPAISEKHTRIRTKDRLHHGYQLQSKLRESGIFYKPKLFHSIFNYLSFKYFFINKFYCN